MKITVRIFSQIKNSYNMSLNKCYIRHVNNLINNQLNVTFLYQFKEGNLRQFNFNRKPSEPISVLMQRISANIQKILNKSSRKKKTEQVTSNIEVQLLNGHGEVVPETTTCYELMTNESVVKMKIIDSIYDIIFNAPWITSLSLPHSILAGFPVYPLTFETQYTDNECCVFNWYKGNNELSGNPLQWEYAGNGFSFTPSVTDIGMKLKLECIPGNHKILGPGVEAISPDEVQAGPGKCPFENRHVFTSTKLADRSFRVVSYNILADLYCDSEYTRTTLHPYCPPYALHIDYRKQLIIKELLGYNADIACLQEVDSKMFKNVLQPILQENKYQGVFAKKGKEVAEGMACFFNSKRFRLLSEETIVLAEELKNIPCFTTIWHAIKENTPLLDRLLSRSTAGNATILQSIENPNEILIVGNTHLYFHPDADHIRLIQGGMLIYWLKQILEDTRQKMPECRVSLIICGDFNSVPSCGIYQLYTQGVAPSDLDDWKSNAKEAVIGLRLEQDIPLGSACGTPEFTNFTEGFADCLDYIYYHKSGLEVEQVVPFPCIEEVKEHTALPSVVFPSDHIALVADLRFKA